MSGFVAYRMLPNGMSVIWGVGSTEEEARAQAAEPLRQLHMGTGYDFPAEVAPATQALIENVRDFGGVSDERWFNDEGRMDLLPAQIDLLTTRVQSLRGTFGTSEGASALHEILDIAQELLRIRTA